MNSKDEMISKIAETVGWTSDNENSLSTFVANEIIAYANWAGSLAQWPHYTIDDVIRWQVKSAQLVSAMTQLLALSAGE